MSERTALKLPFLFGTMKEADFVALFLNFGPLEQLKACMECCIKAKLFKTLNIIFVHILTYFHHWGS